MTEPKTLLVVDDSSIARRMIKRLVTKRRPDWEILEASGADQAIEISGCTDIDCFSVDLNMPGKDGLELIAILKESHPDRPMALLTANIQDATHERSQELAVPCFNKPVTEETVDKLLESLA